VDSAVVVHQVVGCGLGEVVLGLVMHDFIVDLALGSLKFFVTDFVGVVLIITAILA
jgi:hypothetical protein